LKRLPKKFRTQDQYNNAKRPKNNLPRSAMELHSNSFKLNWTFRLPKKDHDSERQD